MFSLKNARESAENENAFKNSIQSYESMKARGRLLKSPKKSIRKFVGVFDFKRAERIQVFGSSCLRYKLHKRGYSCKLSMMTERSAGISPC